jgi:hypothetical protein
MAEDGIADPALAKRKAARRLGLPESAAMPDDSEVEIELRTYQRLFQDQEQQARSLLLLRTAARLMATMQRFNPYLSGSVLDGSAGRYAEIDIQLFPDSAKEVESSCSTSTSPTATAAAQRSCRSGPDPRLRRRSRQSRDLPA